MHKQSEHGYLPFSAFLFISQIFSCSFSTGTLLSVFLQAQTLQIEMFCPFRRSVFESISGASLRDAQQQSLYSLWSHVLYRDVALSTLLMALLLLPEDEPLCSGGLMPTHAICMKLSDTGEGSRHTWCFLNTNV